MEKETRFNDLFTSYYKKVFRLCKGYFNGNEAMASDAAQDIFVKIWEYLDSFRNESKISTWIYRISVNTCLLHLRKQSGNREKATDIFPAIAAEPYTSDNEEKLKKMYGCINKLDEKNKVIILMVLEGISYEEIAEIVGTSEETLRVKIHRIKGNLTKCVQHGDFQ
ncbi:MAG TPA: sigma-70 family RNA polymerase sigma factor [Ohtaekwangia sp.]|nr:sigma-70 family RNA polymerase sigma factor [Ohtaekwangia sp.]